MTIIRRALILLLCTNQLLEADKKRVKLIAQHPDKSTIPYVVFFVDDVRHKVSKEDGAVIYHGETPREIKAEPRDSRLKALTAFEPKKWNGEDQLVLTGVTKWVQNQKMSYNNLAIAVRNMEELYKRGYYSDAAGISDTIAKRLDDKALANQFSLDTIVLRSYSSGANDIPLVKDASGNVRPSLKYERSIKELGIQAVISPKVFTWHTLQTTAFESMLEIPKDEPLIHSELPKLFVGGETNPRIIYDSMNLKTIEATKEFVDYLNKDKENYGDAALWAIRAFNQGDKKDPKLERVFYESLAKRIGYDGKIFELGNQVFPSSDFKSAIEKETKIKAGGIGPAHAEALSSEVDHRASIMKRIELREEP